MTLWKKLLNVFSTEKPSTQAANVQTVQQAKTSQLNTGIVRFFNCSKGYGFIRSKDTAQDIFVHVSDLNDRIQKGDQVTFEVRTVKRGFKAINVALVKAA